MNANRREFLKTGALGSVAVWALAAGNKGRILIQTGPDGSFHAQLARTELMRGLLKLNLPAEVRFATAAEQPAAGDRLCVLQVQPARFRHPEEYSIAAGAGALTFTAAGEQALLYSVFDFLERQGAFFGIDGESYPLEPVPELVVPAAGEPWTASPRFAVRGLLPWPDFLNCITVYNREDFRAYFEAMLRMRFNTFGMHVYTGSEQWAESYLSFEFAGVGHLAFLDNSASHRWGYLPERTSRFTMGGSQFYDGEVFGSDATRLGRDPWEIAERTQKMLREALAYARKLGIRTGVGFEPYQIPDEIARALPPEAKLKANGKRNEPKFDIESVTARKLLEARLGQLLEAYPDVEHVWLWEDENMNWESRKTGIPLSTTPFQQAYDFLKRHAPKKRLVLGGWGGVARHFEHFHQKLPLDVIFTCLSDTLGWDPVHEVFGKLEGRERWPIPWLEDDPAMWLPQFHVSRFQRDLNLAASYGCQGVLGIHWRHRIVDPTAGFQARFSWDGNLSPASYWQAYARTQAAQGRAARLATILSDADRDGTLLSTGTNEIKDGHVVQHEFSGDYGEAFTFWATYSPDPKVVESQKQVASALREIADGARSVAEAERLEYLTRHVEFLVPYTDAWILAQRLNRVLAKALELKRAGKGGEARELVKSDGVPLWLQLAPDVRRAMLDFQRIVATRNDLGTLASMHNKFVRLALVRLRLSMQEFLGELPPETEELYAEVTRPDAEAPARLVLPTRPGLLAQGERVRITILATGSGAVSGVRLHTRVHGAAGWVEAPPTLLGRRTYAAQLGPFHTPAALAEYFVSAVVGGKTVRSPQYLISLV